MCRYEVSGVVISPGELTRLASELFFTPQINVSRLFIALRFVGTSIAYELEQTFFKVSTLLLDGCARSGGLFSGREGVHPLQTSGVVMKTPVKIIKREDRKVTHDVAISSSRIKRQRTTEVIVKNWIIESRERRRADLNHLSGQRDLKGGTRA